MSREYDEPGVSVKGRDKESCVLSGGRFRTHDVLLERTTRVIVSKSKENPSSGSQVRSGRQISTLECPFKKKSRPNKQCAGQGESGRFREYFIRQERRATLSPGHVDQDQTSAVGTGSAR